MRWASDLMSLRYIVLVIDIITLSKLTQESLQFYIVCQYINDTLYIALYMKILYIFQYNVNAA